ncbi:MULTISPECIES: GlxA family transcriptional regulator [Dyella]|uniref:Helix-turn-helix domain-containing protein n=2 Tax=Dyella TaxID=231454 RepID=A0A4R0YZK1_9GAMM|nr:MULTISPECIES: helix-turn-helix domain-containing protein [Dyella]TBR39634.1 helix-turn-helix domain-containing protein [Dyella terrae]TCI12784.1 helix-turn-helix domain-containing protein [Dyella soli]
MRKIRIVVVAFDRISPFHLSVPCAVFSAPPREGASPFRLRVCSAEGKRLHSDAGFDIATPYGLDEIGRADVVIVPSWRDADERPPEALLAALQRAAKRGKRIVGLCLGAFVLAHAGLLNDHRATTHWFATEHLATAFPAITVDRDVLYVDEGQMVTSAGVAAGIDCCLHLVRQMLGAEQANTIARRMVVSPFRTGGQAQFIDQPVPVLPADERMARLLEDIRRQLHLPHLLDDIADRVAMSRRSFTRHFRQLTGSSFGDWLMAQRLGHAQHLLETTSLPLERIAQDIGLGSPVTLRQQFQRAFRTSPMNYRRTFNGERAQARGAA